MGGKAGAEKGRRGRVIWEGSGGNRRRARESTSADRRRRESGLRVGRLTNRTAHSGLNAGINGRGSRLEV